MKQNEMKPVRITGKKASELLSNVSRVVRIFGFETGKRVDLNKATRHCRADAIDDYFPETCIMQVNYKNDVKVQFWNEISGTYEIWFDGSCKLYKISIYDVRYIIAEAFGYVNIYRLNKIPEVSTELK